MRYTVTGATGFIGRRLVQRLVDAGHEVTAVVRDPGRAFGLRQGGVRLHRGDVTDRESLRESMVGCDGVFHVAGWYKVGVTDAGDAKRVNVNGTRNVLSLVRELRIPKAVYTSTLAVFSDTKGRLVDETYRFSGRHLSLYDESKWRAHYEVAEPMLRGGLPVVIVMPGVVYGPGDTSSIHTMLVQYLERRLPVVPRRTAFCWAHIDDVAHAHILAMERGTRGESYIIAGPRHTLTQALDMAARITGIPAPGIRIPPWGMRVMASAAGFVERVFPLPQMYRQETLRVSAGVTYIGDNGKARRELGYDPRPLEIGLRETLHHEMARLGMR